MTIIPRYPGGRLLYCNLPPGCRGMIAINQLMYVIIRPNSEAPYVRPTVSTPATSTKTPASLGPCLIFARLVSLRAGSHTRGAPTGLAIHSALPRQQFTPRRVVYFHRGRGRSDVERPTDRRATDGAVASRRVARVVRHGSTSARIRRWFADAASRGYGRARVGDVFVFPVRGRDAS